MELFGFRLVALHFQDSENCPLEVLGAGCPPHLKLQYACPYFELPRAPTAGHAPCKDIVAPTVLQDRHAVSPSAWLRTNTKPYLCFLCLRSPRRVCSKPPVRKRSRSSCNLLVAGAPRELMQSPFCRASVANRCSFESACLRKLLS